jgi:Cu+-exporting ATPase
MAGRLGWLLSEEGGVEAEDEGEARAAAAALEAGGASVLGVACDGALLGLVAASSAVRPEAKHMVAWLHARGVQAWIASGDNAGAVAAAAASVGIPPSRAMADLTPEGKGMLVAKLRAGEVEGDVAISEDALGAGGGAAGGAAAAASYRPLASILGRHTPRRAVVMMVGDGINDAVALSAADVGVAMSGSTGSGSGAVATAVACDAADVVLSRGDLAALPTLMRLGEATRHRIRSNFYWAFLYNVVAMPLAGGVFYPLLGALAIPPSLAGLSELLSSVPVVLGSLLLYRFDDSDAAWMKGVAGMEAAGGGRT